MRRAAPLSLLLLLLAPGGARTEIRLREVSDAWGLVFRHHHGGSGERYMVETMSGGVVIFDFDRDGDADVFFADGGSLPGYQGETPRSLLYRNDGGGRFVDVTGSAGIEVSGYGNGGAAGDIDNDGDLDLYVTAFGPNLLFRNEGDGTFTEVAASAGVGDPLWGASAAFSDVDRDGDLDLYVANYVDFSLDRHKRCRDESNGLPVYCHPSAYPGQPDVFYRNRGDGSFETATAAAGLVPAEHMAGLGVIFGDLDNDGWPDLYVANDTEPNFFFRNLGGGVFEDHSFLSGTAVSERGLVEAGMGVDLADVDGDGWLDIVVTNFEMETNALYRNLGGGVFIDSRYPLNVAEPSLLFLAFGVAFADLDHDGDSDLVIANGHVRDNASQFHETSSYAQVNQVLENEGSGRFRELRGAGFEIERVSRGLAHGDLDGDGDLDLVIVNSNELAETYENLLAAGHWLRLDLAGSESNRDGVDARVELVAGGLKQLREMRTASSYQSQNDMTLHFGLGAAPRVESLRVAWPAGRVQLFLDLPADRRLRIHE